MTNQAKAEQQYVYYVNGRGYEVGRLPVVRETATLIITGRMSLATNKMEEAHRWSKKDGYQQPEYEGQSKYSRSKLISKEEYVKRKNNIVQEHINRHQREIDKMKEEIAKHEEKIAEYKSKFITIEQA